MRQGGGDRILGGTSRGSTGRTAGGEVKGVHFKGGCAVK